MKTCYVDTEHRAIADLVPPYELTEGWTITRINVPTASRGHGVASRLLNRICQDADRERVSLWLEVVASDGLDYSALCAWYQRHGFTDTSLGYLVRESR